MATLVEVKASDRRELRRADLGSGCWSWHLQLAWLRVLGGFRV